MSERNIENVTEELNRSGLMGLMYPQYQILLTCMADMADGSGGREFSATHTQIAKRSGGFHHGTMTPDTVAELVFDLIILGIVEVVSGSGPISYKKPVEKNKWRRMSKDDCTTYRFGSYERFVKMTKEILRIQGNDDDPLLPPVVPKSSPMRTLQ